MSGQPGPGLELYPVRQAVCPDPEQPALTDLDLADALAELGETADSALVIDAASKGIVMDEDEIKEARRTRIHGPVIIDPNDAGPPPDKFPQRGRLPDTRKYYPSSSESSGGEEDDGWNDSAAKPADSGPGHGAPLKPLGLVPTDNPEAPA